ncbi:hypothetical protein SAMN02800687_2106 [Curtobacterium sp. UNCCL20]|uniref:hypothetical protein n=1 Tax=Curtobacterium sp. UNCCL20 TaxID=1502773 RepID=UPI00088F1A94|nr:hypothetical protein [Curtobacterium sp. UNCCL20]SDQ61514.1 hypothetical protein SAMN02800687_2106 [Curtobacterium sp. UNCCL20]
MPAPRSRVGLVGALIVVLGGVVIGGFAGLAIGRGQGSDVAWVSLLLAALLVVWSLAFLRLDGEGDGDGAGEGDGDGGGAEGDGAGDDAEPDERSLRTTRALSLAIAGVGAYVVIRLLGRPIDTALVGALGVPIWSIVNHALDRRIARREADGGGAAGPAAAAD